MTHAQIILHTKYCIDDDDDIIKLSWFLWVRNLGRAHRYLVSDS